MRRSVPEWQYASDDALYDVHALDQTPLRLLSKRKRYELINSGAIPVVLIGRRRYITRRAIRRFVDQQERTLVVGHAAG